MTNQRIGIDVDARLNTRQAQADARGLEREIDKVNRKPLNPIADDSVDKAEALYRVLLRINREMQRRVNVSGQGQTPLADVD